MKKFIIFLLIFTLSCKKEIQTITLNHKTMPTTGTVIQDNLRKIQNTGLIISSEVKNKGKKSMEKGDEMSPTDQQFSEAIIFGAALVPSSISLAIPTAQDQLGEGACVAFATVYCRDIEYYYKTGASSYSTSTNVFSPEYVYNQTNFGGCASGTAVQTCLDLMVNQGVCLWNSMPYESGDCATQPDSAQRAEAASFKIGGYSLIWKGDRSAIKNRLADNHPLLVNVTADNNFVNASGEFIWSDATESSSGVLPHTVAIVGYDDAKNAYKVLNSWGTSWADNGIGWIDYGFFEKDGSAGGKVSYYTYTLSEPVSNIAPVTNAGFDVTILTNGTAILDGSGSYDSDGYIASYLWEKVSGPSSPTINNSTSAIASITPSVAGSYVYKLTVTDDDTITSFDTVNITVNQAVTETLSIAVTKAKVNKKTVDTVRWTILLNNYPQYAQILYGLTASPNTLLYTISPYVAEGTYSYIVTTGQKRYYRLKVVKSDGSIIYSNVVSIK